MWVRRKGDPNAKKWKVVDPSIAVAVRQGLMRPTLEHEYYIKGEQSDFHIVPKVDYEKCEAPKKTIDVTDLVHPTERPNALCGSYSVLQFAVGTGHLLDGHKWVKTADGSLRIVKEVDAE